MTDEIENEVEETEVEEVETVEPTAVESIIDSIVAGDYTEASGSFNDEMLARVADALDAKRMEVGATMALDVDGETDESGFEDEYVEDEVEETTDEVEEAEEAEEEDTQN